MSKNKLKKGDMVLVLAGDSKGKQGTIVKIMPKISKVVVSDCNIVKKAIKPSESNPKGGFVFKESPIHISNIKKLG